MPPERKLQTKRPGSLLVVFQNRLYHLSKDEKWHSMAYTKRQRWGNGTGLGELELSGLTWG